MLTKTQAVCHVDRKVEHGKSTTFVSDPEGEERWTYVTVERERWEEMGSPEEVTVTIEPGNTLEDGHR